MKVKIGDITKIKTGKLDANASSEDGEYPFFTCSKEPLRISTYSYDCECVLVAGNGDLNVKYYNGKFDAYQRTYIIEDNSDGRLFMPYLYYFMEGYVEELRKQAIGGVIKYIKLGNLTDAMIELPDVEIQKKIVNILSKTKGVLDSRRHQIDMLDNLIKARFECIIEKRKIELSNLDDLIKARFVEMFGDARKNPNKYDTVSFIDIVEYMGDIGSNGANKVVVDHLDMKDKEDYAMMVRFTNFTKNDFTDDVKYVSKEAYDFFKKSQIFGGELIICKIGSAGQNYVMPYLNRPVSLGLNQIMVRIKDNILMPYLYQYLHTDYGEFLISGCINGAVTKTITKTELKKIPVMLPPMELQREFVAFVEQVDKSKVVVQKAFDETQMLYDSLLQEFFG